MHDKLTIEELMALARFHGISMVNYFNKSPPMMRSEVLLHAEKYAEIIKRLPNDCFAGELNA